MLSGLKKSLKRLLPIKLKMNIGKNFNLNARIFLIDSGSIKIGKNVHINSSLRSNPVFKVNKMSLISKEGATLIIGDDVGISNATIYCENEIVIGNSTLIGSELKVWGLNFHSIKSAIRKKQGDLGLSRPVKIGSDCFVGADAIITKGDSIGSGFLVGASSTITKSIGEFEFLAGNPAKFIRRIE